MRLRPPRHRVVSLEDLVGGARVPPGLLSAPDPAPEQVAEAHELLAVVRLAVATLPDGQRAAVLMHDVGGLSCQEVAALLGRSTGAVRVRLHRARAELRQALAALDPEPEPDVAVERPRKEDGAMVEVTLEDVVVRVAADGGDEPRLTRPHRIVLLRERGGERLLPIRVGPPEGDALALHRGGVATPRPLTAELTLRLLEATGGRVERVTISSLRESTFFAVVALSTAGGLHEVDARPSDALNLAVRAAAPIFADAALLDEAGIAAADAFAALDEERVRQGLDDEEPGEWRSLSPELIATWAPLPPPR